MSYIHIITTILIFSWLNFCNASNLPPVDLPALPPKAMPAEVPAQAADKQLPNQQELKQEESNKQQDDDTAIDWKKVSLPQEIQQIQQKDPAGDAATGNADNGSIDTSAKDSQKDNTKPMDAPSQPAPLSNTPNVSAPPSNNSTIPKPEISQKPDAIEIKQPPVEAQFMNKPSELNDLANNLGTSPEQAKFINDESKMLLLPDDDIVLGRIAEDAIIEEMNFEDYLRLFAKSEQWYHDANRRESINHFVSNYDKNFNSTPVMSNEEVGYNAFWAAANDNLFALRALADNFSVLDKIDDNGNSLVHTAAFYNNERIVEFLVMKGANISKRNFMWKTALDIATSESDEKIIRILRKASGNTRTHFK